jgi:hypothetical protein
MLESDYQESSQRRGRFIIQEIEEEVDDNLRPPLLSQKRPKHSSIIMDSKIIHTTRMDSNCYSEYFSTIVWDEARKDWIDFENVWKNFSRVHRDCLEDDMEKIFHYIDNRLDDSDFFCLKELHDGESIIGEKHKFDENYKLELKNSNSYKECKIMSDAEKTCRETQIKKTNTVFNLPLIRSVSDKESNAFLNNIVNERPQVLTNFCARSFVSPAVSPISSSKKLIHIGGKTPDSKILKSKILIPNEIKLARKFTFSEKPLKRKSFESQLKQNIDDDLSIKKVSHFILSNQKSFELVHNVSFTLTGNKKIQSKQIFEIVTEYTFSQEQERNICFVCKKKFKE